MESGPVTDKSCRDANGAIPDSGGFGGPAEEGVVVANVLRQLRQTLFGLAVLLTCARARLAAGLMACAVVDDACRLVRMLGNGGRQIDYQSNLYEYVW